ncbi:hypothetical protein ACHAPT_008584 [Fusarium lateritium]
MGSACRILHRIIKDHMVRQDIASRTGDALFWACTNDHTDLAKYVLEKGASPHTYFCTCGKPGSRKTSKARANHSSRTGRPFVEPLCEHDSNRSHVMYPKKGYKLTEVSALVLAARADSVAVMQILLDHGAQVVEKNWFSLPGSVMPWEIRTFRHRTALSHVRSAEAAKVLVKADPGAINDSANTRYTPLEIVLAQYITYDLPDRERRELFDIVKFLISKGARPRRQGCRSWLLDTTFTGGPLMLAMTINCEEIVKLILESDPVGVEDQSGESTEAFMCLLSPGAANERFGTATGYSVENNIKYLYLDAFVKAGFPLNKHVVDKLLPMTVAIRHKSDTTIRELIRLGADVNGTDDTNMHPISHVVCRTRSLWIRRLVPSRRHRQALNQDLLEVCNIDGRSFHQEGFTPLMFATSDMIMPEDFKALIDKGADVGVSGRLQPSSPPVNILQCILQGFPRHWGEEGDESYAVQLLDSLKPSPTVMGMAAFRRFFLGTSLHRRHAKLEEFFRHAKSPDAFYTPDGENILKWAFDNLYAHGMKNLVVVAPHICKMMRKPGDKGPALDALFSSSRCTGYLEFGTLELTFEMAELLLEEGLSETEAVGGDTLLHRVFGGDYDISDDLLMMIQHEMFAERGCRLVPSDVEYRHLVAVSDFYEAFRSANITQIVLLLLDGGADIHARNAAGKTPYNLLKANGLLPYIPTPWNPYEPGEIMDGVVEAKE